MTTPNQWYKGHVENEAFLAEALKRSRYVKVKRVPGEHFGASKCYDARAKLFGSWVIT